VSARDVGMTLDQIVAAGKAWAEREASIVRDGMWEERWLPTWHDALPLVEGDYDDEDRAFLAQAINEAAVAEWADLRDAA
jgi:hypothetical protein